MDDYTLLDWTEEIMLEADTQEDEARYDGTHPNGLAKLLLAYPGTREQLVTDRNVAKLYMMLATAVYHIGHVSQGGPTLITMLGDLYDQAQIVNAEAL